MHENRMKQAFKFLHVLSLYNLDYFFWANLVLL